VSGGAYIRARLTAVGLAAALAGCAVGPPPGEDGAPPGDVDVSRIPDAVPHPEPLSRYGNPPEYWVDGHRYHTLRDSHGYHARGVASWYGYKFHGRLTSSREPYDMFAMTAAHRSLPLPTYARVTNLRNGRAVVVRINDRGPFHGDRLIDLSYAAAAKLGILRKGTGLVEVDALDPNHPAPASPPPAPAVAAADPPAAAVPAADPPATGPSLFVQVGAFANRANAERLLSQLDSELRQPVRIEEQHRTPVPLYRVRVGPLASVELADDLSRRLRALGLADTHLVVE
jgi:rare lipoprotein A